MERNGRSLHDKKQQSSIDNEVKQYTSGSRTVRPGKKITAADYMKNYNNISVTENGAVGYKTTTNQLVDLNFKVSSLRDRDEEYIVEEFIKAYYESPKYAVKWLFFLRDILEGLGERRSFRICMKYLAVSHTETAKVLIKLIPEYGRYDDLLLFLDTPLENYVCRYMKNQLKKDTRAMKENREVSLLAKWLPSINTSSVETRENAYRLAKAFGMSYRIYRKTLSSLRSYINVTEVYMSANRWSDIDYSKVPAKANMRYDTAFGKHDTERRINFLINALDGGKLNAGGLMPYEIARHITGSFGWYSSWSFTDNMLAEAMWKKISEQGFQNEWGLEDCIVVADGSGSMYSHVTGNSNVTAIDVCNSLAIYFAEQLKGVFHNKAITFSETPRFIDLDRGKNLKEKLEIMFSYNEVANTNIEAVFNMLLDMAVSRQVPDEEIPKQVLVISDMEFDMATGDSLNRFLYNKSESAPRFTQALFDTIEQKYNAAGYHMPRLIFWNVCGRTDTIPKVDNENGICLLSGFSQNAMKIAADREKKDPYESLIKVLDGDRYKPVEEVLGMVS